MDIPSAMLVHIAMTALHHGAIGTEKLPFELRVQTSEKEFVPGRIKYAFL